MKFSFVSPLRIAVWTRVVREDDLSNEVRWEGEGKSKINYYFQKMNLLQFLFEESKLPRVKVSKGMGIIFQWKLHCSYPQRSMGLNSNISSMLLPLRRISISRRNCGRDWWLRWEEERKEEKGRRSIQKEITPADLVFVFKGTMIYPSARKRCLDLFMVSSLFPLLLFPSLIQSSLQEEAFFREKIPSDSPEYKEILRLFANSCVREAELLKIKVLLN